MKNKKVAIIFIIIVILVAILAGSYKILTSYIWTVDDGEKINDGHIELVNRLKKTENPEEKKKQVDLFLESNSITKEEAKEILGE